ncbi:hypothetical protein D6C86_04445 [Aureobasidium pullulans]|uniref:BTB domain-containing protein n=1 Tax=Aureobasidium pullulans TaxID=5580 RepID=A0A4V4KVE3_AURPU|nr:hypothetical protein D6C94_04650 [Aureobasidium pullulans]THZ44917.1 hypothetical protein D6C87_03267 [Aureobasidium pullulans]THZ61381.1 hypothetical protein D6C86_04445 [Aureobasidium pullulans]THZ99406.1 hypothetical protein D6C88_00538 [Aureobasidium pullulans]
MSSSSRSKTGSLSSAKSFYSPIITVRVGPDNQEFCIHKGVLCSNSNYFAKALSGQFQEAKTNTVELDDVHVLLFKVFRKDEFEKLDTMLNDQYPFDREDDPESDMPMTDDLSEFDAEDPTTWTHTILCALFVLADRLDTPRLKVLVLDFIPDRERCMDILPSDTAILYSYANTTKSSPLRRLIVHIAAYTSSFGQSSCTWNHLPPEFLTAVLVTLGRRLPTKQCKSCFDDALQDNGISDRVIDDVDRTEDMPPFRRDICFYHEHKDEEEKETCRAEREKQGG